jgi:hypothetical protein
MNEANIKSYKRNSAVAKLQDWCSHSHDRDQDFIQVTEWSCEGGFDVEIHDKAGTHTFNLTWGQWVALNKCVQQTTFITDGV